MKLKGVALSMGLLGAGHAAFAAPPRHLGAPPPHAARPAVDESGTVAAQSVAQLQAAMTAGRMTAESATRLYLDRIARIDVSGPALHSIVALNPHALADARKLDAERKAGRVRGPLHGVPVLLKDNIESADDTATTAGSLALPATSPTATRRWSSG